MTTATTTQTIDALRKQLPRMERRLSPTLSLRAEGESEPRIAMFIPYDKPARIGDLFTEFVAPGAFKRTLAHRSSDVVALWNHDAALVLGRESNGTLTFRDGKEGLEAVVTLDPENSDHQKFHRMVQRRDVKSASFAFEVVEENWRNLDDGTIERTLEEVKLYDVSPVTFPAYPDSESESRALAQLIGGGTLSPEQVPEVRSWIEKLQALIPEVVVTVDADYEAQCARLERAGRIAKGRA